jgi:hypothetical protein
MTYYRGDITKHTVVTVPGVGGTPRTYLALGSSIPGASVQQAVTGSPTHTAAMIWE